MAEVEVTTDDELIDAIQAHGAGDVIHVSDIDRVDIPAGTILDGEGVTVICNEAARYLLRASQPGIVIENIRLIGPQYDTILEQGWWDYEISGQAWNYAAEAIGVYHSDVTVRHCEISGWTHAAISVGENYGDDELSPHIYGNRLVNNNARALGYGVVVMSGNPLIEWNYFNNNRHDIAGGDWEGVSYEARYNHVGDTGRIYAFECHPPGGRRIHIHHNTFEDKYGNYDGKGTGRRKLIRNRGTPTEEGLVENNWFKGEMVYDVNDRYTFENNYEGPDEPPADVGQPRPPEIEPGIRGVSDEKEYDWLSYYPPLSSLYESLSAIRENLNQEDN